MIPPVEVRQVRPCRGKEDTCVSLQVGHYHLDDECKSDMFDSTGNRPDKCKYNLYAEELKVLIDSGKI